MLVCVSLVCKYCKTCLWSKLKTNKNFFKLNLKLTKLWDSVFKKVGRYCTVLVPYSKVLIDIFLSLLKVCKNSAAALYQVNAGLGLHEKVFYSLS